MTPMFTSVQYKLIVPFSNRAKINITITKISVAFTSLLKIQANLLLILLDKSFFFQICIYISVRLSTGKEIGHLPLLSPLLLDPQKQRKIKEIVYLNHGKICSKWENFGFRLLKLAEMFVLTCSLTRNMARLENKS